MFKKTVEYTDFNGETVSEDLYFHFSEVELIEMELSVEGGLSAKLEKMISTANGREIVAYVKELILDAYGERSEDGKRFIKNDEVREAFSQTQAFSTVLFELLQGEDAASKFINALLPPEVVAKLKSVQEGGNVQKAPQDRKPAQKKPAARKPAAKKEVEG